MRRRGTIERRDHHQFRASISVNGKRFRKTFGSESDAEAWLRRVESELLTNRFAAAREAEAITLGEALDRYESHVAAHYPKASDHLKKLRTVRLHLAGMKLLERPLSSILTRDIAAYRNARLSLRRPSGRTLAGETVRKDLSMLSRVFTVARAGWGLDSLDNPVTRGVRPSPTPARMHRIDPDDWDRLLVEARKYQLGRMARVPLEHVLRLAMATTMRLGELESLRWENVDLDRRTAYIPPERDKAGSGRSVPLASPQGGKGHRWLGPLCADLGQNFPCREIAISYTFVIGLPPWLPVSFSSGDQVKQAVTDRFRSEFGEPTRQTVKVKAWDVTPNLGVVVEDTTKGTANVWLPYPPEGQPVPEIALEYPAEAGRHSNTYASPGLKRGLPALKLIVRSEKELDDTIRYIDAMRSMAPLPEVPRADGEREPAAHVLLPVDVSLMPAAEPPKPRREAIPRVVQREVWQRDGGRCVECGTKERLCFDHIVPFSRGGSNSVRNLQLLCEGCNLSKGNRL